jgi:hypothetical protein
MDEWTLEKDYPALEQGYMGAIQKEVLYVFNPASFILRKAPRPVILADLQGQVHQILENTLMLINNAVAARNPRNWNKPKVPPERSAALLDSPALYINPDRWLKVADKANNSKSKSQDRAT